MIFRATAFNAGGLTFRFTFRANGWGKEIENNARKKLESLVANDEMHKRCGPWDFRNVDVSG